MGLTTREKVLLVACVVLVALSAGLEIGRQRALRKATEASARLSELESLARSWRAEAVTVDSLLELEQIERQALWEEHDALRFRYDSLTNRPRHAPRTTPRTAPALRRSILRAIREQ